MRPARLTPLATAFAACLLLVSARPAGAQNGLVLPAADWPWPELEARITVQTAQISLMSPPMFTRSGEAAALHGVRGGAVFGDYVFWRHPLGKLRATGGLILGTLSGMPALAPSDPGRLGVGVVQSAGAIEAGNGGIHPYLGVGYSSPALWRSLSVTADLGLVGAHPGAARSLFGSQAMDAALRELRLSPTLQLSVRYAF